MSSSAGLGIYERHVTNGTIGPSIIEQNENCRCSVTLGSTAACRHSSGAAANQLSRLDNTKDRCKRAFRAFSQIPEAIANGFAVRKMAAVDVRILSKATLDMTVEAEGFVDGGVAQSVERRTYNA